MNGFLQIALILFVVGKLYHKAVTEFHADVRVLNINSAQPLAITITNPNITPFYLSSASIDVYSSLRAERSNPIKIAHAEINTPVYLAPHGSTEIKPTIIRTPEITQAIADMLVNGKTTLTVTGSLTIGIVTVPLDFTKEILLTEILNT